MASLWKWNYIFYFAKKEAHFWKHWMWNSNAEQRVLYTIFAIGQDHFQLLNSNFKFKYGFHVKIYICRATGDAWQNIILHMTWDICMKLSDHISFHTIHSPAEYLPKIYRQVTQISLLNGWRKFLNKCSLNCVIQI